MTTTQRRHCTEEVLPDEAIDLEVFAIPGMVTGAEPGVIAEAFCAFVEEHREGLTDEQVADIEVRVRERGAILARELEEVEQELHQA